MNTSFLLSSTAHPDNPDQVPRRLAGPLRYGALWRIELAVPELVDVADIAAFVVEHQLLQRRPLAAAFPAAVVRIAAVPCAR